MRPTTRHSLGRVKGIFQLHAQIELSTNHLQFSSNVHVPGNTACIAKQFLRCTIQQLSTNGIFQRIFSSHFSAEDHFFKAMAISLSDYTEVNQITPIIELLKELNERKHLPPVADLLHMCDNMASYCEHLPVESISVGANLNWPLFLAQFDTFLKSFVLIIPQAGNCELASVLKVILITMKLPLINSHKVVLDSYSKVLSLAIQQSTLEYERLMELCALCCKSFVKERDR